MSAVRYCKLCGLGPREWMECEMPDCEIETQAEADERKARAILSKQDPEYSGRVEVVEEDRGR